MLCNKWGNEKKRKKGVSKFDHMKKENLKQTTGNVRVNNNNNQKIRQTATGGAGTVTIRNAVFGPNATVFAIGGNATNTATNNLRNRPTNTATSGGNTKKSKVKGKGKH